MTLSTRQIAAVAILLSGQTASAQGQDKAVPSPPPTTSPPTTDTGVKPQPTPHQKSEPRKLPWHGSIFVFDQSVTTQTVGVGTDYLSANPVYEQWYSLRPKYYLYESKVESIDVNARIDLFLELTNSDTTTYRNEPVFGDPWFNIVYGRFLYKDEASGYSTKAAVGGRVIPGLSKTSQGRGTVAALGVNLGLEQTVPINGPKADVFQAIGFNGGLLYLKPFNRCTTPCNPSFTYVRQDTDARSFESDQLAGTPLINHSLLASLGTELSITQTLKLGLAYIWVMQWAYRVDDRPITVNTLTGPATVQDVSNPTHFQVSPWLLASLDFDPVDEIGMSLGYYNYTSQIGPNGERRNPLWSPDARFFFSVIFALDAIYQRIAGPQRESNRAAAPSFAHQELSKR